MAMMIMTMLMAFWQAPFTHLSQHCIEVILLWVFLLSVHCHDIALAVWWWRACSFSRLTKHIWLQALVKLVASMRLCKEYRRLQLCQEKANNKSKHCHSYKYAHSTCFLFTLLSTCVIGYGISTMLCQMQLAPLDLVLFTFFLLSDFHKYVLLSRAVLAGHAIDDCMRQLAPDFLLDNVAKCLFVGLGGVCGVEWIEQVCRGLICLLVVSSAAFLFIYPALLTLNHIMPTQPVLLLSQKEEGQKQEQGSAGSGGASAGVSVEKVSFHTPCYLLDRRMKVLLAMVLCGVHVINTCKGPLFPMAMLPAYFQTTLMDFIMNYEYISAPSLASTKYKMLIWLQLNYDNVLLLLGFLAWLWWWSPTKLMKQSTPITSDSTAAAASVSSSSATVAKGSSSSQSVSSKTVNGAPPGGSVVGTPMVFRTVVKKASPMGQRRRHTRSESSSAAVETPFGVEHRTGHSFSDEIILEKLQSGEMKTRNLESELRDPLRAVFLRRQDLAQRLPNPDCIDNIPWQSYDYKLVTNQCCEEVIGYVTVPLGKVGPLLCDGQFHHIPMATTEGCLVASTTRGCRVVEKAGGVKTYLHKDQMTRAPVVRFPSIEDLKECKEWIESTEGFSELKKAFESTSSHAELLSIFPNPVGRLLHMRFSARTGEAMGMNMVSKGTDAALKCLVHRFPKMKLLSVSGNMCSDKKACSINSILGRGKSVVAECLLSNALLKSHLRVSARDLAELCLVKNFTGSAAGGGLGLASANAHAANVVAAIFLACGQDIAQVVESASCCTIMECIHGQIADGSDDELLVTVTMPCIEVGTIGGGTRLSCQSGCLSMLDLSVDYTSQHLARIVAATVLASEISLMAALSQHELVEAHMRFNRRAQNCTTMGYGGAQIQ